MLDNILNNLDTLWLAAASIVTLASVITAGTPTPDPATHPRLAKVYGYIEALALVIGKAKK